MIPFLESKSVDSPRLSAEILLTHVLQCDRLALYTGHDRPASPDELATLRTLVARAGKHEPIAYLTGEAWFFGLPFEVNASTLIPRPSTETLIEHVLQRERSRNRTTDEVGEGESHAFTTPPAALATLAAEAAMIAPDVELPDSICNPQIAPDPIFIADIGTGSGCIAIALAVHLPHAHILAVDISPNAIEVAQRNAARHGVTDRITFVEGSLLEPLQGFDYAGELTTPGTFDYVVSNPPYISDSEWADVEENVKAFEPTTALRAGEAGLDCLQPLIAGAFAYLQPAHGQALFEMAASQSSAVQELVRSASGHFTHPCVILNDLDGHPRIAVLDSADEPDG